MKSKKYITLFLFFILLSTAIATLFFLQKRHDSKPPLPRDYKEILSEGILRIVTEYNPSGFYVSGDTLEGFQYELSQAISKISGLEVQMFLEMSIEKSFKGLVDQKYDIIAQNIPITSELREQFIFTEPLVLNKHVLVQKKPQKNNDTPLIRNQLDLAKKTLHIPKNSPAFLRLMNLENEIGDTIYIIEEKLYSSEQLIIMVARGEIEYAVCDKQIAVVATEQFPEIDFKTDISFTQLQSWALRKESTELRDSVNEWLQVIRNQGLYNKIYERYY